MKAKYSIVGAMIACCTLFGGLATCTTPSRSYDQSEIRLESIALMPFFKGRHGPTTSDTLDAPISDIHFNPDSVSIDSDSIITGYVWESLHNRYGEKVVPLQKSMEVYNGISMDASGDSPRTLAQKLGRALGVKHVMAGRERITF